MPTKPARGCPGSGGGLYPRLGVPAPLDPAHELVTSYALPAPALAALRLTIGGYALFVVIFELVRESVRDHTAQTWFSYFTHLSYVGLIAYEIAAGVQTLAFVRSGQKGYPLQRWPRILQFLHRLLYSTITTFPLVVTVVFWALLSGPTTLSTTYSAWDNISVHALNTFFLLTEVLLTNVGPSPWLHLPICIILLACYLGVAYITNATQGFYTYSFLDPAKEHAKLAAYIVGIAVAECVAFLLARGATWARLRLVRRFLPLRIPDVGAARPGSALSTGTGARSEEWEEVEVGSSIAHAV